MKSQTSFWGVQIKWRPYMENLIHELRSVIGEKNITIADAARMIGISRATLYNWINGRKPLNAHRRLLQNAIKRMKEIGGAND